MIDCMHKYTMQTALIYAIFTGVALFGVTFAIAQTIDIPASVYPILVIGLSLFLIVLSSVSVYQSLRIYESANVIAKDITKGMVAHSQDLFVELYRNSPVPYLLIDRNGTTESVNFSTARLFNTEITKLEGINIFNLIEGDDEQKIALIPEYFKEGRFVNDIEVRVHRSDGVVRWVILSLFSFNDKDGNRRGLMTLVDITKQKQIDRAKSEFVSLASHQLRTPISAMRWNLELFSTATLAQLNEMQKSYILKIENTLGRMQTLIDDFLNVSKLELGTLVAQRAPFDLTQFFSSILDEYRVYAQQREVEIATNWGDTFGEYVSDSHLLNMAVSNVMGNALKYTPEHGTVYAFTELTDTQLTIQIRDTGIGIPEEDKEMIFTKLFRASNTQVYGASGTGLGLYIVKEAIGILGGTITFESNVGQGTTFTIVLPK